MLYSENKDLRCVHAFPKGRASGLVPIYKQLAANSLPLGGRGTALAVDEGQTKIPLEVYLKFYTAA